MRALAAALVLMATPLGAETITAARYTDETSRYAHGVLGDAIEWGALELQTDAGRVLRLVLPDERVFEDLTPRLRDLDGDGKPEVIAIESHAAQGARLSIYGVEGLITATDYIGRSFRWLAPAGVGDFDGDGVTEVAFVDRPHLAKTLRVFEYKDQSLTLEAEIPGVTNHRIGEAFITGGVRDCGGAPEMVLADARWQSVVSVAFDDGAYRVTEIGPFTGTESVNAALGCS